MPFKKINADVEKLFGKTSAHIKIKGEIICQIRSGNLCKKSRCLLSCRAKYNKTANLAISEG